MSEIDTGFISWRIAVLKKFPFLERYIEIRTLSGLDLGRVNLDLLIQRSHEAFLGPNTHTCTKDFFVINSAGGELAKVTPTRRAPEKKVFLGLIPYQGERKVLGKTVYETVLESPDTNDVRYIVEVSDAWYREEKSLDLDSGVWVTVHKIPQCRTFSEWLDELAKITNEKISKKLQEIDSV